jgi:hypothetical protein
MENNKDKERMLKLISSFEKKGEIYLDKKKESIDEAKLSEETKRTKELATKKANEFFKEDFQSNYGSPGMYKGGQGKTVSSIADDFYKDNTSQLKTSRVPLQAEEALEVSVKRTLKSGAPINNISFYDEVNWHLQSLGFPAKTPIEIKEIITNMLEK